MSQTKSRVETRAPGRAALCALLLALATPARGAAPTESDAERLFDGMQSGFRRPEVAIYPLLDQRALAVTDQEGTSAKAPPPPEAWSVFVEQLAARQNLKVSDPERSMERLRTNPTYKARLEAARIEAGHGYSDYREVRLERAAQSFRNAVRIWREIEHQFVDPRAVARAELTRGLALLEHGNPVDAELAFREALLIDPTLRLRPGFDRPETIEVFEKARTRLAHEPPPPAVMDRPPKQTVFPRGTLVIRARALADRLELTIETREGLLREVQPLGNDPASDGNRLASRVYACLPFGRPPPRRRHRRHVYVDAGFSYFLFTETPVGVFSNVGFGLNASWLVAPNISLDGHFELTNSNRDVAEDLRADVATLRGSIGPGYAASWGRWRLFTNVGFEAASPGRFTVTTDADCKFFRPEDHVPPEICDFKSDIDEAERSLLIGAALSAGGSLRLVDKLFLAIRLNAAEYFFETEDIGLGRPVGAQIGLGYRLN